MKKFLSAILAAALITASAGCSGAEKEETSTTTEAAATTTAAETTTTADEAEATESEATSAPESDENEEPAENALISEETSAFLDKVKAGAPIYGSYLEENYQLPIREGFAYDVDLYGTGTLSKVNMDVYMESFDRIAIVTIMDGTANKIILDNGKYYIVSDAEKTAMYVEMSEEDRKAMSDEMFASVKPNFDADLAAFETGTKEYDGTEYIYEKVTAPVIDEIGVYADKETQTIKYLETAGIMMEITAFDHEVDSSVFEIPADYQMIDMMEAMGDAGSEEAVG